jgi:hypothetical protein
MPFDSVIAPFKETNELGANLAPSGTNCHDPRDPPDTVEMIKGHISLLWDGVLTEGILSQLCRSNSGCSRIAYRRGILRAPIRIRRGCYGMI